MLWCIFELWQQIIGYLIKTPQERHAFNVYIKYLITPLKLYTKVNEVQSETSIDVLNLS